MAGRAAPVLETARLTLRPLREDDLGAHAAMLGDPEVVRFLGGATQNREETWRKLLAGAAMWNLVGFGYWVVERREDGRMIGQVGFADFKRDMTPAIEGLPEMGWILAPDLGGQGYAAEAVAAGLAWADEILGGAEIVAIINHDNMRSIRLAERSGFAVREEATYRGAPILLFRRPGR